MAIEISLEPTRTYATRATVRRVVAHAYGNSRVRYFIQRTEDDRYFPVFVGQSALDAGVHFLFHVIG